MIEKAVCLFIIFLKLLYFPTTSLCNMPSHFQAKDRLPEEVPWGTDSTRSGDEISKLIFALFASLLKIHGIFKLTLKVEFTGL